MTDSATKERPAGVSPSESLSSPEVAQPREVQRRTLEAVTERLRNITSGAIVNRELRDEDPTGIPSPEEDLEDLVNNLKLFYENLDAAADKLAGGQLDSLPPNPLDPRIPDLQFTDYTQSNIQPTSPQEVISERK